MSDNITVYRKINELIAVANAHARELDAYQTLFTSLRADNSVSGHLARWALNAWLVNYAPVRLSRLRDVDVPPIIPGTLAVEENT